MPGKPQSPTCFPIWARGWLVLRWLKVGASLCRLATPNQLGRAPRSSTTHHRHPHQPLPTTHLKQSLAHSIGVAKLPRSDQVLPFPPLHQRISSLIALLERGNTSTPWYGDADNGISWLSLTRVRVKIIRTWEVEERGGMRRIKRSDSLSTSHHQKSFRNQRGES
jgi:hypothetical protein